MPKSPNALGGIREVNPDKRSTTKPLISFKQLNDIFLNFKLFSISLKWNNLWKYVKLFFIFRLLYSHFPGLCFVYLINILLYFSLCFHGCRLILRYFAFFCCASCKQIANVLLFLYTLSVISCSILLTSIPVLYSLLAYAGKRRALEIILVYFFYMFGLLSNK